MATKSKQAHVDLRNEDGGVVPEDTFAVRLRWLRHDLAMRDGSSKPVRVEDIAKQCGLGVASWSNWENGASPRNMHEVVRQIARATGYSLTWLMWGVRPVPDGGTPPGDRTLNLQIQGDDADQRSRNVAGGGLAA